MDPTHLCWWCCAHAWLLISVMHVIHIYGYSLPSTMCTWLTSLTAPPAPGYRTHSSLVCLPSDTLRTTVKFLHFKVATGVMDVLKPRWSSNPELSVAPHAPRDSWLGFRSAEMRFRFCMGQGKLTGALPALAVLLSPSSGWGKCYTAGQKVQSFHCSSTVSLPPTFADGFHVYFGVRLMLVGRFLDWFVRYCPF